jgi:NTP pyrophosphatase (non-canonical NTP hydrolase)
MQLGQITELQEQHEKWVAHNFPDQQEEHAFLGMVEEVGELAHAILKYEQGIRGYNEARMHDEVQDSLGDLFVYMMSFCNRRGYDLEQIILDTWGAVMQRDWIRYPDTGRAPSAPSDASS